MVKGTLHYLIELRIIRGEDYSGLSRRALQVITRVRARREGGRGVRDGAVMTEVREEKRSCTMGLEEGRPASHGGQAPSDAGEG